MFSGLFNFDFAKAEYGKVKYWVYIGIVFLFVFGIYDMLEDTGAGLYRTLTGFIQDNSNPFSNYISNSTFKYFSYSVIGVLMIYITVFAILSFRISENKYGKEKFHRIFISHLLANAVSLVLTTLFFACIGLLLMSTGLFTFEEGKSFIGKLYDSLSEFVRLYIPTITDLPRPIAVVVAMIIGALPGYIHHRLGHEWRFMWLLNHRTHHTAAIMHPAGVGPFEFLTDFFSKIPSVVIGAICSKLVHSEPLILDIVFLSTLHVLTEKFNHSSAFYDFAYKFKPLRWLSSYFGNGVYHYMHHSAIPGDEIVNIGSGPFLFWDRVFGTYKDPYPQAPPVGLTNQPDIVLNPFRLVLSGWQQIGYELWHNKNWWIRFKILFGSVWYMPPVTKDFLKAE